MTPRELLDAYAEAVVDVETTYGVYEPVRRAGSAPKAFAALRAVLELHPRLPDHGRFTGEGGVYDDCHEGCPPAGEHEMVCPTCRRHTGRLPTVALRHGAGHHHHAGDRMTDPRCAAWVRRNEDKPWRCPRCHLIAAWDHKKYGPRTRMICPGDCRIQWRVHERGKRLSMRSKQIIYG